MTLAKYLRKKKQKKGKGALTAFLFVAEVSAVVASVAEQRLVDAQPIGAGELAVRTLGFGRRVARRRCLNNKKNKSNKQIKQTRPASVVLIFRSRRPCSIAQL